MNDCYRINIMDMSFMGSIFCIFYKDKGIERF